ncbi:hypothetical protein BT96DRAFT_990352 [Gymnopus androsaceus JB14]|uniref:PIN domain-like protein n=1 Tax=Gymnopus androsaceus JB14 TaxID=1447944 RepID=A0A6A4HZ51_9AGAR|nr:hypothetical protein BT96DRAFT_990352 [Gymnopus androsaceus JB14]
MGVQGLTTFLREHRALSKTVLLPSVQPVHFVVDGWSFIFELAFKSSLPWVYGGEYPDFARLITSVVQAWLAVGVKLSFVFDGPAPEIKFRTLMTRMAKSHIEPSLLFFRTSQASRSTPRLQASSNNKIDIHFADEEGDPYAVELAGRLGAYVVANDSDFVILNSEGYLGFIPLEGIVWQAPIMDAEPNDDHNDDFQPVRTGKRKPSKNPNLGRGIIPPSNHLISAIPITLLPLVGALAGNDFSNQSAPAGKQVQQLFFESRMNASARITRVASTLQSILSKSLSAQRKQAKYHVDSVMDLIDKTVKALLIRSLDSLGSGEVENLVERIVESTLQYAIPRYEGEAAALDSLWPTELCALHEPSLCPMIPFFSRNIAAKAKEWAGSEEDLDMDPNEELIEQDKIRGALLQEYRAGRLAPNIIHCLASGTLWPRFFLENPDVETTSRMTRPIRQWYCAILDDAVGLPDFIEEPELRDETGPSTVADDDEDEDELIDVAESDSEDEGKDDPNSEGSEEEEEEPTSPSTLSISSPRRKITEYLRRGTRVVDEIVVVPSFHHTPSSQTPFLSKPVDERLTVMLHALSSNTVPNITDLPPPQLLTALAFRWLLRSLRDRAMENPSKENQLAKWTENEARCFLASFDWDCTRTSLDLGYPAILDRNVQLSSQVLVCMDSVHQLAEVMILSDRVSTSAHLFSGRQYHSYLTGTVPSDNAFPRELWAACVSGLEDSLVGERVKVKKNKKKNNTQNQIPTQASLNKKNKPTGPSRGGLFDLLGDVEAEA